MTNPSATLPESLSSQAVEEPGSFEHFRKLPREIRDHIWHLAVTEALQPPGVCVLTCTHFQQMRQDDEACLMVYFPNQSQFNANTESRRMAKRVGGKREYWPGYDTLYVPFHVAEFFSIEILGDCLNIPSWFTQTENLAVDLELIYELTQWLMGHMLYVPVLKTVSLVVDNTERDPFRRQTDAEFEKMSRDGMAIHNLTDEELKRLRFHQKPPPSLRHHDYDPLYQIITSHFATAYQYMEHQRESWQTVMNAMSAAVRAYKPEDMEPNLASLAATQSIEAEYLPSSASNQSTDTEQDTPSPFPWEVTYTEEHLTSAIAHLLTRQRINLVASCVYKASRG